MNPPTFPCNIQPFPSRIHCRALLLPSPTHTLKHPAGISPPPAPSHHLFIFINADSLLWRKPVPSELPFQLSMALHLIWIFFACHAACYHSSTVGRMWQRNHLAEGKPQSCQGMQNPDAVAFPSHHWCALCGALMLLHSSLSEGFAGQMQQKMDLGNHRKQKGSPDWGKVKRVYLGLCLDVCGKTEILISFFPLCVQAGV